MDVVSLHIHDRLSTIQIGKNTIHDVDRFGKSDGSVDSCGAVGNMEISDAQE
jgi:hypothetical protein